MTYDELATHVAKQVENMLCCKIDISDCVEEAVDRTVKSLMHINSKYVECNIQTGIGFSVYNSVQYCMFLYNLSRVLFISGKEQEAEKVYYLNKILHSIDVYYKVELPLVWSAEHPLGSVMGRARYSDYFFFYQGCTVGGSYREEKLYYPSFGNRVVMYANSTVLGNSKIGNNVIISATSYIINETIPDNCIVFGQSPDLVIKPRDQNEIIKRTRHIWKD